MKAVLGDKKKREKEFNRMKKDFVHTAFVGLNL